MILCGLGIGISQDEDERDKEGRLRGKMRRFLEKSRPDLGCKLVLGLVEGISCRLQSCNSPLNTLQGQEEKLELIAQGTSDLPTQDTVFFPIPMLRVTRASFTHWVYHSGVPNGKASSSGTNPYPGLMPSSTVRTRWGVHQI